MTIKISNAASAARALVAAARAADKNRDGSLTTEEIRGATKVNGKAATKALLAEHSSFRASVAKDREIPQRNKSAEMKNMDINVVSFSVDAGVEQLKRIDAYKGTKRPERTANTPDGVVNPNEIANYHHTKGKLQIEAGRLAAFTKDKDSES